MGYVIGVMVFTTVQAQIWDFHERKKHDERLRSDLDAGNNQGYL